MPELPNKERGDAFEKCVQDYFAQKGIALARQPKIKMGFANAAHKEHAFDLGNESILVECKTSTSAILRSSAVSAKAAICLYWTTILRIMPLVFRRM